jgi:NUDIX domain
VKTASGAIVVQIVWSSRGVTRNIDHIGPGRLVGVRAAGDRLLADGATYGKPCVGASRLGRCICPGTRQERTSTIRKVEDHDWRLNKEEFRCVYSKVPRMTVEIVVRNESGALFLTRRSIDSCKDQRHLPGGTVQFGESLITAVRRLAMKELSINVHKADNCGYIAYPSHYLNNLDHPVGLVFEVTDYSGDLVADAEASNSGWFTKLPDHMHADQDKFLLDNGYLAP